MKESTHTGQSLCEVDERPAAGGAASGRRGGRRRAVVARCEFCTQAKRTPLNRWGGGVQQYIQLRTVFAVKKEGTLAMARGPLTR